MSRPAPTRMIVAVILWLTCATLLDAQHLRVRLEGDRLRVSGPQLRFLTGRALERLHNGAVVTYVMDLTVRSERQGRVQSRVLERFTFSYDLWEEKFAVTRIGTPTRSVSNLSLSAAEAWCLDSLSLSVLGLSGDRQIWIGLEYETEEPKEAVAADASGLTLSGLIDIFSRRPRDGERVRGVDEVGPIRLDDLRKKK